MKLEPNIAAELTAELKRLATGVGMTLPELIREMDGDITNEDLWRQELAESGRLSPSLR